MIYYYSGALPNPKLNIAIKEGDIFYTIDSEHAVISYVLKDGKWRRKLKNGNKEKKRKRKRRG